MFEGYKELYVEKAKLIPDYKKLTRNELANKYIENEDTELGEAYLSALILKFWNVITHNYETKTASSVTEDDAYSWVILGILAALKERPWLDENSSLFNDPNGPEKAINVKCFQNKCRYYQVLDCDKRKINKDSLSLEGISEDASEDYFIPSYNDSEFSNLWLADYLKDYFINKEYLKFFILDAAINSNITVDNLIDDFQLRKHFRKMSPNYIKTMSEFYDIDKSELSDAVKYFTELSSSQLTTRANRVLKELSRDSGLKSFLMSNY